MEIGVWYHRDYFVHSVIFLRSLLVSTNRYTGQDFSPLNFYRAINCTQFPLEMEGIIFGGCKYNYMFTVILFYFCSHCNILRYLKTPSFYLVDKFIHDGIKSIFIFKILFSLNQTFLSTHSYCFLDPLTQILHSSTHLNCYFCIKYFDFNYNVLQVIAFQKARLTKQNYLMEVCMYQLDFISWRQAIKEVLLINSSFPGKPS